MAGKAFPSVCCIFSKDGELLVGEPARRQAITNTENTIREQLNEKWVLIILYKIQGKEYKPQQISAFILTKNKKRFRSIYLGEKIEQSRYNSSSIF